MKQGSVSRLDSVHHIDYSWVTLSSFREYLLNVQFLFTAVIFEADIWTKYIRYIV